MTTQSTTLADRNYISRITQIEGQLADAENNCAERKYELAQDAISRAELFLSELPKPTTAYQIVRYNDITEAVAEARILISKPMEEK